MKTLPDKELLRPNEIAEYFSVSIKTVYGWIDQGKLDAVKLFPSGPLRIKKSALQNMISTAK